MIEAVLFDLDGTLADTARDLGGALNRLLDEEGRPSLPLESIRPHVSGGAPAMLGLAFGIDRADPAYANLRLRFLDHYQQAICVDTRLFEGIPELLTTLAAQQIAWGIVTNKTHRLTLQVAAALGLDSGAACIVSGDSTPNPKPAPDPLLLACQLAGIAPENTLYVGDDPRDVQAGKAAGMDTIAVSWGYLGAGAPILEWGATHVINQPSDLLRLIA